MQKNKNPNRIAGIEDELPPDAGRHEPSKAEIRKRAKAPLKKGCERIDFDSQEEYAKWATENAAKRSRRRR